MTHRGGGMKSNQTSGNEKNLSNIISSNSDRPYQYSNKNTNQRYSSYKYSKTDLTKFNERDGIDGFNDEATHRHSIAELCLIAIVLAIWLFSVWLCLKRFKILQSFKTQWFSPYNQQVSNLDEVKIIQNEQETIIYPKCAVNSVRANANHHNNTNKFFNKYVSLDERKASPMPMTSSIMTSISATAAINSIASPVNKRTITSRHSSFVRTRSHTPNQTLFEIEADGNSACASIAYSDTGDPKSPLFAVNGMSPKPQQRAAWLRHEYQHTHSLTTNGSMVGTGSPNAAGTYMVRKSRPVSEKRVIFASRAYRRLATQQASTATCTSAATTNSVTLLPILKRRRSDDRINKLKCKSTTELFSLTEAKTHLFARQSVRTASYC